MASGMGVLLKRHWIAGVGVPKTPRPKVTSVPATTVRLAGWLVKVGGTITVSAASALLVLPATLLMRTE